MKTINVSVEVSTKVIQKLIKAAGVKVKDKAALKARIESPEFAAALGNDMLNVWLMANDDSDPVDIVVNLLGEDIVECDW